MVALFDSQYDELPIDQVIHGDCLEVLRTLPDNSVDAIVTDPPAGISFMNKAFDSDRGGRDQWIAWLTAIMQEALRVLRPGGHAFVWALPRTSHWTAMALEDAGFEIRDVVAHMFGSGFPKSMDVSAAIDKHLGKEREVIGISPNSRFNNNKMYANGNGLRGHENYQGDPVTAPATPESAQYAGWGSNLKPSHENWLLVRKPLAEKTIAAQVLATGTGALNIDISRVGGGDAWKREAKGVTKVEFEGWGMRSDLPKEMNTQGRFPSNTLFSHSSECVALGEKRVRGNTVPTTRSNSRSVYGDYTGATIPLAHADEDGCETVAAYECAPDCPVAELDRQSGVTKTHGGGHRIGGIWKSGGNEGPSFPKGDQGGASRYFKTFPPVEDMVPFTYQSKASRRERNEGCEALPQEYNDFQRDSSGLNQDRLNREGRKPMGPQSNHHPTVKSLSLMSYLIRMITSPDGVILDMFAGSGTTGVAAVQCGFHYILVEQEAEYIDIIRARIAHAHASVSRPVEQEAVEYDCAPGCPVAELGRQSGVSKSDAHIRHNGKGRQGYGINNRAFETSGVVDQGTAARFFKTFPPEPTLWDMAEEEVTPHA